MKCTVRWNPGTWPYVTNCMRTHGHQGDHQDKDGKTIPNVPGQDEDE